MLSKSSNFFFIFSYSFSFSFIYSLQPSNSLYYSMILWAARSASSLAVWSSIAHSSAYCYFRLSSSILLVIFFIISSIVIYICSCYWLIFRSYYFLSYGIIVFIIVAVLSAIYCSNLLFCSIRSLYYPVFAKHCANSCGVIEWEPPPAAAP